VTVTSDPHKRSRPAARIGAAACVGAALAGALALSGCAEAQLGVALAKRANDSLTPEDQRAPSAVTAATQGPGAMPSRVAQKPGPRSAPARAPRSAPPPAREATPDRAVFFAEAATLWDGLPSMGGAWIAHPAANPGLMVEALNLETERSLRAPALRLAERAGHPPIQLSAEAALALGMSPGRLARVRLTGLREAPAPAPATEIAAADAAIETFALRTAAAAAAGAADVVQSTQPVPRPEATRVAAAPTPRTPAPNTMAPNTVAPATTALKAAQAQAAPYVQIGAFAEADNAAGAARKLRGRDLPAFEMPSGRLRLVLLGPFDDLDAAQAARDVAVANGFADAYITVR
jgi:cell division septation protein DedD